MMSDIFNIFSIDWWMDENNNALQMTDSVLFLLLAIVLRCIQVGMKSLRALLARKVQEPLPGGSRTAPFPGAFHGVAQRERGD